MRVQNRKTGAEHIISLDEWNFMKSQNLHLIFKVIDKDSAGRVQTKINIPDQINEFRIAKKSVEELKIETAVKDEFPDELESVKAKIKPSK